VLKLLTIKSVEYKFTTLCCPRRYECNLWNFIANFHNSGFN